MNRIRSTLLVIALGLGLCVTAVIGQPAPAPAPAPAPSPPSTTAPVREGVAAGEEWVNALGAAFCWCPPGTFTDGNGSRVSIARGFWIGKFEVTKREFDLVTPKKPRGALAVLPDHPRDAIRYNDILQFIRELNRRERFFARLPAGWEYALPTEDEWEYACRAGTGSRSRYSFGDAVDDLPAHANFADRRLHDTGDETYQYADRRLDDGHPQLAPVGRYAPNAWGLHDMHGNLWEWTATFRPREEDPGSQPAPVARGGSWVSLPEYCQTAFRHRFGKETERNFIGFRLVLRKEVRPAVGKIQLRPDMRLE